MLNNLRYGLRSLWKSPGFVVAAVLTLTLGSGVRSPAGSREASRHE